MVYTCCVPRCKGNYPNTPKVQLFSFPKETALKQKWLSAIPRKDFVPTMYSKVCENHFGRDDIRKFIECYDHKNGIKLTAPLARFQLREGAIPSIFQDCPKYLSTEKNTREEPEDRRMRIDNENLQRAIKDSLSSQETYDKENKFSTLTQLCNLLNEKQPPNSWSSHMMKNDALVFFKTELTPAPYITVSAVINKNLELTAYHGQSSISMLEKMKLPIIVDDINDIFKILQIFSSYDVTVEKNFNSVIKPCYELLSTVSEDCDWERVKLVKFIAEQLKLATTSKENMRYSAEFMVFCSILYTISPHGYKFLRSSEYIILPHPRTIQRLCSSLSTSLQYEQENFLKHVTLKSSLLKSADRTVILMLDEIHIKPYLDFKGGNIVGMTYNCENMATTAHVFMIQSLLSSYKEVVRIVPVKNITAKELHGFISTCVIGLEKIGFSVIAVVSDNNSINRKAMHFFSSPPQLSIVYPHPSGNGKPLFYFIDSVHIFKCIRNNWLNQKNCEQAFYFPNLDKFSSTLLTASFFSLKKLHEIEKDNLVKFSYNLNIKSLFPTNFERQNVKLVTNIFNEYIIQALKKVGVENNILNAEPTAAFLEIIYRWWCVVNVKTPFKGVRLRNDYQKPISDFMQINFQFLCRFLEWMDFWKDQNCSTGTLTKETHLALTHTTHALIEMSKYCIQELKFQYFLPGKIQTDALEHRFGKYRSLAGSQYLVSMRQIYEAEAKLRVQDFLPLTIKSNMYGDIKIRDFTIPDIDTEEKDCPTNFDINISESCFKEIENVLPVLIFLAGYCARAVLNKVKCKACSDLLVTDKDLVIDKKYELILNMDRGGLLYPQEDVVNVIVYCFVVVNS